MDDVRTEFLRSLCRRCIQPAGHDGCGLYFRSILAPIRLPEALSGTHDVCSFCLGLHQRGKRHEEFCVFAKNGIRLTAGGWVTPASDEMRRSMRQASFPYRKPLTNLIRNLLKEIRAEGSIIAPLPMSSPGKVNRWLQIVVDAAEGIEGVQVLPLIRRDKNRSARKSVAQERARIAQEEYSLDVEVAATVPAGARIILLDDNVTSGETIIGCVDLAQALKPRSVHPLTIDRALSGRALQRLPLASDLLCPYFVAG